MFFNVFPNCYALLKCLHTDYFLMSLFKKLFIKFSKSVIKHLIAIPHNLQDLLHNDSNMLKRVSTGYPQTAIILIFLNTHSKQLIQVSFITS